MDPNATWDLLGSAISDGDLAAVEETAGDLISWLEGDGFMPRAASGCGLHRRGALEVLEMIHNLAHNAQRLS